MFGVVHIVAIMFARNQHVQGMMDVVVPLGGVPLRLAALPTLKISRLIAIVFEDKVDVTIGPDRGSDSICQFLENVWRGIVDDGVNRVQTKSVEIIFSQPVQRIVDEEITDDPAVWTIEIDTVSPGSTVPIGKELWRVGPKIISFRAEVVVNDIQQNHHSALMGALNQLFKILRPAVNTVGSE